MTARVMCVGGAVIDLIYEVDALPSQDGKMLALSYRESGGGMAANAAVIVARLGGEAAWCGRLGDDDKGRRILDGLRQEKVDVRHARLVAGVQSSHSIVLVDGEGNRAIIIYRSDAFEPDTTWLPISSILQADAIVADNRWVEGASLVLSAARQHGKPAVLDADTATDRATLTAVRAASHAIFSTPGLAGLYGTPNPGEGLRQASRDCPFVAVTMGGSGVMWIDSGGMARSMPAFPIGAVETVGAGDIFHGAFALALVETRDEVAALRFASATAALKCMGRGGRASFPDRAAVEKFLNQHPPEARA
ncbi:sugar kinase [Labrys wisconsinensis]|uniref:Sulfofructose kinase n=1 Tax=Labrys wisconsinensis TaxID=425677 RepID=A0ABU0J6T6_9HYPH|nr:sugar kinase [Labrys wisconsinensis]MDQ0469261.1 sulfofructose kinase [Labrys wisconsinensis]